MGLYQKHRPQTLDDIVGNTPTVSALRTWLSDEKRNHAVLLTGPSGCGKTTVARILANGLGCAPVDLVEMNSANFRGIDTAREIIQRAWLSPIGGPVRVWILDEVHQGTQDFQSAILKVLEDTPQHVYFLLATTDPQKLLKTVVNRCTQYAMQPLPENRIRHLLSQVAIKEGAKVSPEVLDCVAKDSQGCPRDALNTLGRVLGLNEDQQLVLAQQAAREESEAIDLCRALLARPKKKWAEVAKILRGLQEADPERVRLAVLGYCNKILIQKDDPVACLVIDCFNDPFYNNRHAGLSRACYMALVGTE